jgi:hypothetical protein
LYSLALMRMSAVPGGCSARILAMEHRLYPLTLRLFASGAAWLDGSCVTFAADAPPPFLSAL